MRGVWKTVRRIAALFTMTLVLGGCCSSQIVDRISLVQTVGYDRQEGKILTSLLVGEYTEEDKTKVKLLEAESNNSFDMVPLLNKETNKPIEYGQMRLMMFGRSYAEQGIANVLKILSRDVKIQNRCLLAVSDTTAREAMAATADSDDTLFLMNMIAQNTRTAELPGKNLQEVMYGYYGEGRDFFLPYITMDSRHKPQAGGVALFKGDRIVAVAKGAETLYLKLLSEKTRAGMLLVPLEQKGGADQYLLLRILNSRPSWTLRTNGSVPSFKIALHMKVGIKSIAETIRLEDDSQAAKLEQTIERFIETGMSDFIEKCQKLGIDPAGFGDYVRTHRRSWDSEAFYAAYPTMKAEVRVNAKLMQSGTID
ncbi:Ger(x)C family spore germination protein [Cohnella sp. GCM10012308]|uniref:Ger(x)C family spore germination protein n=1 Tax=Cohnella sp. GCM10012308 TaxID=3317329 RepID=UPI00361276FE